MDMNQDSVGLSVTQRIGIIKQPRGGYLKPKDFSVVQLDGGTADDLNPQENVSPALVGMAVDYLTRSVTGSAASAAFMISRQGASIVGEDALCAYLLSRLNGLEDESIIAACKLAGFDSVFRAGVNAYRPVQGIEPDTMTIDNVRTMVNRSVAFFEQYGPKTFDGLTFKGGYTPTVSFGDGDFMTADTL